VGILLSTQPLLAQMQETDEPRRGAEDKSRTCSDSFKPGFAGKRLGFHVFFLGPNTIAGAEFALEQACWAEGMIGLGYNALTAEAHTPVAKASADGYALSLLGRERFWIFRPHSLVLEVGTVWTHYRMEGTESNLNVGSFRYFRTGSPLGAFAGGGYGYHSDSAFRLAVVVGGLAYFGGLDAPDVETPSGFPASDREALIAAMTEVTDELLDPSVYLEVSVGWLF
jgi:hypothetical protein